MDEGSGYQTFPPRRLRLRSWFVTRTYPCWEHGIEFERPGGGDECCIRLRFVASASPLVPSFAFGACDRVAKKKLCMSGCDALLGHRRCRLTSACMNVRLGGLGASGASISQIRTLEPPTRYLHHSFARSRKERLPQQRLAKSVGPWGPSSKAGGSARRPRFPVGE